MNNDFSLWDLRDVAKVNNPKHTREDESEAARTDPCGVGEDGILRRKPTKTDGQNSVGTPCLLGISHY
jgi:hypothetical protein